MQTIAKYNDNIDRESAYEILNAKIKKAETEEAKEKAKQERATVKRSSRRSSSNSTEKAIIKVLTSATVIRGVLGILTKMIKK